MSLERVVAALAAALMLAACVWICRRRIASGSSRLEPLTLFLAVWGFSLGLFAFPLIAYTTTSAKAWALIYLSIAAFCVGAWFARHRLLPSAPDPAGSRDENLDATRVHLAWLIAGALSLVGFAFFLRAINETVGWRTIFEHPDLARTAQNAPAFNDRYGIGKAFSYMAPVSLLFWTIALRLGMFSTRWRRWAPLEAVVMLPYFVIGERQSLITALLWIAAFHLLWKPFADPRRVAAVVGVFLVGGAGYFLLIGGQKHATISSHPEIREQVNYHALDNVALPYLYATGNFPLFGQAIDDPIAPRTYGQLTFSPVAKVAHRVLPVGGTAPSFDVFYPIPFDSYNSATWLGPLDRDFGPVGCVVVSLLLGYISTWAVIAARRRRTISSGWLGAVALGAVAFSPLKSQLPDAITWELLVVVPLTCVFLDRELEAWARRRASKIIGWLGMSPRTATVLASVVALAIVAAVGAGLQTSSTEARGADSRAVVVDRLSEAGARALRVYREQGPSTGSALASQLENADPATHYQTLRVTFATPREPRFVGVFANENGFRLSQTTADGQTLEAVGAREADRYLLFKPRADAGRAFLVNGDFEELFGPPWIADGTGLRISQSETAHGGEYGLQIEFAQGAKARPSFVSQTVTKLPETSPGTRYRLTIAYIPDHLSRQLLAGFQILYRNGSSDYAGVSDGTTPRTPASGFVPGPGRHWRPAVASAVARLQVKAIRVFLVDTGAAVLRGKLSLDDVVLTTSPAK